MVVESTPSLRPGVVVQPSNKQHARHNIITAICLIITCVIAVGIRSLSVLKNESVIQNFDPYFNYRTTKFLTVAGTKPFWNWFDDRAWYPLGRVVGGTLYPGLMLTSSFISQALTSIGQLRLTLRQVCIFLAPAFGALTSLTTFALSSEIFHNDTLTALLSALFIAIAPSYISRSSTGSFDNEGVAIFALVSVATLWLKSLRLGSASTAAGCAVAFWYMAASWGGYVFILNLIAMHAFVIVLIGRYSSKLYVAYSCFHILSSIFAMQIPFIGFNIVYQSESLLSHMTFVLVQARAVSGEGFLPRLYTKLLALNTRKVRKSKGLVSIVMIALIIVLSVLFTYVPLNAWSGRSLSLLDPTYAAKYMPIIASVSEHQPSAWATFYRDFGPVLVLAPLGTLLLFQELGSSVNVEGRVFLILYSVLAWYFASVMIRLTLCLAPAVCIICAYALSKTVLQASSWDNAKSNTTNGDDQGLGEIALSSLVKTSKMVVSSPPPVRLWSIFLIGTSTLLGSQLQHCGLVSWTIYSFNSIVRTSEVSDNVIDDLRDGYSWLRYNTPEDAKIMAWWDYGYQLSSMANRTVLVDNNTWNNTHIATVGRAFASTEENALPILQSLDVEYIYLQFGGKLGHYGDDLNKFGWFLKIAQGVFPTIVKESDFRTRSNITDNSIKSLAFRNSLIYKLSYNRFANVSSSSNKEGNGYDVVRRQYLSDEPIHLRHFEEVFTSTEWLVRIYKVKPQY